MLVETIFIFTEYAQVMFILVFDCNIDIQYWNKTSDVIYICVCFYNMYLHLNTTSRFQNFRLFNLNTAS